MGHRNEAIGCFRCAAATGGKTSFGPPWEGPGMLTEDRNQEAEQDSAKRLTPFTIGEKNPSRVIKLSRESA